MNTRRKSIVLPGFLAILLAPASAQPVRAAPPVPEPPPDSRWAVLIGVKTYGDKTIPGRASTPDDLNQMRLALIGGAGYESRRIITVTDEKATLASVRSVLAIELPRAMKPSDSVLVYFAGQGAAESAPYRGSRDATEKYLLLGDSQTANLYGTALSMTEFSHLLCRLPAARVLVFLDASFTGAGAYHMDADAAADASAPARKLTDDYLARVAVGEGVAIVTAGRAGEPALESSRLQHGVFTYYLLQVLRGKADANGDGLTTLYETLSYLTDHVANDTRLAGGGQHPVVEGNVKGDFPVAWTTDRTQTPVK